MIAQQAPVHPVRVSRSEPRLVGRSACIVAGLRYLGRNEEGEIAALWREFEARAGEFTVPAGLRLVRFGVERRLPGHALEAGREYVAGAELVPGVRVPSGMVQCAVPAGAYAVVTAHGFDDVRPATTYFYHHWLPQEDGIRAVDGPSLQLLPSDFAQVGTILLHFPVDVIDR